MEKHMQEYPKALYLAGQLLIVADEAEEAAARESGHLDWQADQNRDAGEREKAELDRDALKTKAKELGIEHAPNITTEKLAALVATTVASANPT